MKGHHHKLINLSFPDPDLCPGLVKPCQDGEYYAHAQNCTLYYVCNHNRFLNGSCPPGTAFDIHKKQCLHKNIVDCGYRCLTTIAPPTTHTTFTIATGEAAFVSFILFLLLLFTIWKFSK